MKTNPTDKIANGISPSKNIALFGTSADPPTRGHQTILKWLSRHYDLVVVWASDNPYKAHQTSLSNRSAMLNLIIREIDACQSNITLTQEISDRKTLITVQKARQIWQNAEFTLVIGADLIAQIINWYRIEELLQEVKILIFPRFGYSVESQDLAKLQSLGGKCTIADLEPPQVSSSLYRLHKEERVVTPAVRHYIEKNQLYLNLKIVE